MPLPGYFSNMRLISYGSIICFRSMGIISAASEILQRLRRAPPSVNPAKIEIVWQNAKPQ